MLSYSRPNYGIIRKPHIQFILRQNKPIQLMRFVASAARRVLKAQEWIVVIIIIALMEQ